MQYILINKNKILLVVLTVLSSLIFAWAISTAYAANSHSIDLELDSSQYLSIADGSQTGLDITGDMSIEFWWKPESPVVANTDDRYHLVGKHSDVTGQRSYTLDYYNNGSNISYRFIVSDDGTSQTAETYTVTESAGVWAHIAVTYDASAGAVEWYRNGISVQSDTGAKTSIFNGNLDFTIGANDQPTVYMDGKIDDIRVWNDVRTPTEISNNYQKELVGNEAGLVGYWKLNNSLMDETSNNNDLTNNNGAIFSTDMPFIDAPVLSNLQSSSVISNSATIAWTTDVSSDSEVIYGTSTPVLNSNPLSTEYDSQNVTSHSLTLVGLESNTTYYYIASSTNTLGISATSTQGSFTTLTGSTLFAHKPIDQFATSTTELISDDYLSIELEANKTYVVTAAITASSTAIQPDIKTSFEIPTGATMALTFGSFDGTNKVAGSGLYSSNETEVSIDLPATGVVVIQIDGTVTTGSTAGSVNFEWAQNTSSATEIKVFKGSYMRAEEI